MSKWTLDKPPTHLTWTDVDIWLTTYPSLLVHVVIECPLARIYMYRDVFKTLKGWVQFLRIHQIINHSIHIIYMGAIGSFSKLMGVVAPIAPP